MRTAAFHTLGCKLNFSETSTLAKQLIQNGFSKVDFNERADVYIINTCSVTENADRECKTIVHRALEKNPEAFIAITGCYAQLKPEQIALIPGVDLVLGATEKFNLINYLNNLEKKKQTEIFSCEISDAVSFHAGFSQGDRTRVFLKVQDGCDFNCSFCTIPLARGKSRSNIIVNVIAQVEEIILSGAKEIVLTGVNLGDFGKLHPDDKDHTHSFFDLVNAIENVNGKFRVRISSIEPNLLSDDIIEFVASSQKFVPHFHIPLQSGSDKILKSMRRRYLTGLYRKRVEKIKSLMPHCCIGVDVITGFPGETERDFLDTYNFINSLDVSYLHVFTYSERDNTHAITLDGIVSIAERKRRTKMLRMLSGIKLRNFYSTHVNKKHEVLFEGENKNGFMFGYTENYIKIKAEFNPSLINSIVNCSITGIDTDGNANCLIHDLQLALAAEQNF